MKCRCDVDESYLPVATKALSLCQEVKEDANREKQEQL